MDLKLGGRRALVTGSTAGIGYAIAETLAREGAAVTLNGRDGARLDSALARMRAAVPAAKLDGVAADVATGEGSAALTRRVPDADILVNNVTGFTQGNFFELTDEDWRSVFEGTVNSGVRLSRFYAPGMRNKGWGRIVFISSESGMRIPPEFVHYGACKAAQIAVARGLANVLKGTGVTVNSVLPGPTLTERFIARLETRAKETGRSRAEVEADFLAESRPSTLLRRFATPQETANLVAFVAGEGSSAITGASLRVEGGIVDFL